MNQALTNHLLNSTTLKNFSRNQDKNTELMNLCLNKLSSQPLSQKEIINLTQLYYQIDELGFYHQNLGQAILRSFRKKNQNNSETVQVIFDYRTQVLEEAERFLKSDIFEPELQVYYLKFLAETNMMAMVVPSLPAIDFPLITYISLQKTPDYQKILPLSVASLIYYMGISLYDDVIDNDLEGWWQQQNEKLIALAAISMFSGLPTIYLQSYYESMGNNEWKKLASLFQEATYKMSIGQYLDIGSSIENSSIGQCENIIQLKTGSTGFLLAKLAATLVTNDQEIIESYGKTFQYLYMSMQVTSDIHDIWGKILSPDLENSIPTLPIVFAYNQLNDDEKEAFRNQINSLKSNKNLHQIMRDLLTEKGSLHFSLLKAELLRKRAVQTIEKLPVTQEGQNLFAYLCSMATLL
ncbi:MAG: polyprenyl synthetase family protein [Nodularia sp. CChRGM 3473]